MTAHPDQWFGDKTYSQHGEDLMICNIFKLLGIEKPSYLDIGCHHPWNISNTALLYKRGSRGVCVDPNPNLAELYAKERPEDKFLPYAVVAASPNLHDLSKYYMIDGLSGRNTMLELQANSFVREHPEFHIDSVRMVPTVKLSVLLNDPVDFLSMDCEGMDVEILKYTKLTYNSHRPIVLCFEILEDKHPKDCVPEDYFLYARMGANAICLDASKMHLYQRAGLL